jgi:hypothetical protein
MWLQVRYRGGELRIVGPEPACEPLDKDLRLIAHRPILWLLVEVT